MNWFPGLSAVHMFLITRFGRSSASFNRPLRIRSWYSLSTCASVPKACPPQDTSSSDVKRVTLTGWIRSIRRHRTRVFFDLSDGSSPLSIQVVTSPDPVCDQLQVGSAVTVDGYLTPAHRSATPTTQSAVIELKSSNELVAERLHPAPSHTISDKSCGLLEGIYGTLNPRPDLGLLRSDLGLAWRHRLPEFGAMLRLRSRVKSITRQVTEQMGYLEVDTPMLTTVDCEASGETFAVQIFTPNDPANQQRAGGSHSVRLTGSSQLHLEALTVGLGKVYTLSPAFRAEPSNTRHHLAEFHMLEVESVHLNSVDRLCDEMEAMLRLLVQRFRDCFNSSVESDKELQCDLALVLSSLTSEQAWSNHRPSNTVDLNIVNQWLARMDTSILSSRPFVRLTFEQAKSHLHKSDPSKDFSKEEERFLVEHVGQQTPIFITHFPHSLKPFYCQSSDGYHADAADLLVPQIGELFGGSVREVDPSVLMQRVNQLNDQSSSLSWYTDLRQLGNIAHGGFGMGFERFLQFLFGVWNIRDVIPFPRTANKVVL